MNIYHLDVQTSLTRKREAQPSRKMSEDAFPKSVNLGDRAVAWVESEVDDWMESILLTR
ncbi:AlpA family phage regulatory protein [Vibrio parahaemolyticus]|uniref:AlpA family phage regulatory protein n=1 Tax=Vibrio parahaemolyticus TaxID=670 RepID=UPI0024B70995|nr:AlpA family phage regulatory protein [Vibrio parahaemolyticus]WHP49825.1 AlpA family phage regulatory protein [Vibrio parahaemolyticus]